MDRLYRVFVSSTFTDLVEERREVMQALLELDCMPAGMELFPSSDAQQWDIIERTLDNCDYYIVVVGGRYGSLTAEGISYTEKEYDLAQKLGIPILGFIHGDPGSIPAAKSDLDKDLQGKLEEFRKKVEGRHIRRWSNADQLGSAVSRSLTQEIQRNPRSGWVRGDNALTPELEAELRALRAGSQSRVAPPQSAEGKVLRQGDDLIEITFLLVYDSYTEPEEFTKEVTWDRVLQVIGDSLITEAAESQLRIALCNALADTEPDPGVGVYVAQNSWAIIVRQLRALGYIELGTKARAVTDSQVYWTLAPAGEERIMEISALYREG
ncbi:DUF4062 domain-containing protein [Curtobacterium sp. PhB136]|uniref:DUF4062 domain-containing protein n=1 Tax=Curtobacterium sp. PhB136 TaxID=2485181 RepID=UPI00104F1DA5|nr:DUF4062 domain-containing protein [Curtobacterium sp. PhB136]TCK63609.1 uncharacterized protein DUF4062 [Curtobacterium sp. PhB136]